MDKFLDNIQSFLDTEKELTPETCLHDIEDWDSLATVSFLAMVNVEYDKVLSKTEINKNWTLKELFDFVKQK